MRTRLAIDAGVPRAAPPRARATADERDAEIEMRAPPPARRRRCAAARRRRPSRRRRSRSSSRIQDCGREVLFLVDRARLAAAVVAAVRADAVRRLRLVAVRAFAEADGFSASCVRRLAVRVFECRRFGFGISVSVSSRFCSVLEFFSSQFFVLSSRSAASRGSSHAGSQSHVAAIQVRAAHRAQALAAVAAERLHRQRQIELLAHQLAEVDLVVLVERRRQIVFFDLALALRPVFGRVRLIAEVERPRRPAT